MNKVGFNEVHGIALRFGVEVKEVKRLYGFCDANYLIKGISLNKQRDKDSQTTMGKFVLKVRMNNFLCDGEEIAMVVEHLHANGFAVSLPLTTLPEKKWLPKANDFFTDHPIHMYKYIEGKTVYDTSLTVDELTRVAKNLGFFAGVVTECLQKLPCQLEKIHQVDTTNIESMELMQHGQLLREHLDLVEDKHLKHIIEEFLKMHEIVFLNKELRRGFIHGDLNDTNIVIKDRRAAVSRLSASREKVKNVFGIIDFEFVHCGWIVCELAIMIAFLMVKCVSSGAEPNAIVREVLAGFQSIMTLTERELEALYCIVGIRLAASVVHILHRTKMDPERGDEISFHAKKCPEVLKALSQAGKSKTLKVWLS